jgi:hypothetical protein
MNAIDETIEGNGSNPPAGLALGSLPSRDGSAECTWDEDVNRVEPEAMGPADQDGRLRTSQNPRRRGDYSCGEMLPDEPAILCARIRELAHSCHSMVRREAREADPPTLSEIDEVLNRLISLRLQLHRLRVLHGLRTGELDRWAWNLFRTVAVLEARGEPGRSS